MSFDMTAAAASASPQAGQAVQAGYGASLTDAAQFNHALGAAAVDGGAQAEAPGGVDAIRGAMKGMMDALESVNGEATQLGQAAGAAQARGTELTPGEMVMLTMRCQEFMFHCQLTSNIANRTSDGLQQLFRQQG